MVSVYVLLGPVNQKSSCSKFFLKIPNRAMYVPIRCQNWHEINRSVCGLITTFFNEVAIEWRGSSGKNICVAQMKWHFLK